MVSFIANSSILNIIGCARCEILFYPPEYCSSNMLRAWPALKGKTVIPHLVDTAKRAGEIGGYGRYQAPHGTSVCVVSDALAPRSYRNELYIYIVA